MKEKKKNYRKIFESLVPEKYLKGIILAAITEDTGEKNKDLTSYVLNVNKIKASAKIITRENCVLCGVYVMQDVFKSVDPKLEIILKAGEGQTLKKNAIIAKITGRSESILKAERVALNFLQHMSGIATITKKYAEALFPVKLLDTRKTIPGLRRLQKYSVLVGNGNNHRFGLYDGILIKENHIKILGAIENTLERIKKSSKVQRFNGSRLDKMPIEIEVRNITEVKEALKYNTDIILLDNMSICEIKKAVKLINKRKIIEVSGNIDIRKAKELSKIKIDYASAGAITHSVKSISLSLLFTNNE